MKRNNYINWDQYFMMIAIISSMRSKDPDTQVGACIVKDHKIIGTGYNGMPNGCSDNEYPWCREGDFLDNKYPYVCHAELNAISNSYSSVKDSKIYCTLFPCNECAKIIIQSGIKEVIYLDDKYKEFDSNKAAVRMFNSANISMTKYSQELPVFIENNKYNIQKNIRLGSVVMVQPEKSETHYEMIYHIGSVILISFKGINIKNKITNKTEFVKWSNIKEIVKL